jgi:hypothetical protein
MFRTGSTHSEKVVMHSLYRVGLFRFLFSSEFFPVRRWRGLLEERSKVVCEVLVVDATV